MNQQVTDYINNAPENQKQMMTNLRKLIHNNIPGVKETIKWSRPVFSLEKDLVYFKTSAKHLTLGFFNFGKITDPENKLEGSGNDMRHIKLRKPDLVDIQMIGTWLKELAG